MNSNVEEAVRILRGGGLILYPTDTIWGIGCDARNEEAVRRVFALKQRADSKSLVLLARDEAMIGEYVEEIPEMALQLLEVNDAPMTIIYPGARIAHPVGKSGKPGDGLAPSCVAADGTVGMRIPHASGFCMELLKAFGAPMVSTSANISGNPSPKSFDDVDAAIKAGVDHIVARECEGISTGAASQIIKVDMDGGIKIIRG